MNETEILVRLEIELKERLKELADSEGRSLNNLIKNILRDYCRKNRNVRVWKKEKEDGKQTIRD